MGSGNNALASDPQTAMVVRAVVLVLRTVCLADAILFVRWVSYRLRLAAWARLSQDPESPVPPPVPPFAPRWSLAHVFVAAQVAIGVVILGALVPLIPLIGQAVAQGNPTILQSAEYQRVMLNTMVATATLQNVALVAVVVYLWRRYSMDVAHLGLSLPSRRLVLKALGAGVGLFVGAALLENASAGIITRIIGPHGLKQLTDFNHEFAADGILNELHGTRLRLGFFIGAAIAAPIGEEFFFRGLLYNTLKFRHGIGVATVVSALIFALAHVSPLAMVVIFPMGLVLAYAYEKTHSLWVSMILHATNNSLAILLSWQFSQLNR